MKHISYLAFLPVILAAYPFAPAAAQDLTYTEGNPVDFAASGTAFVTNTTAQWASFTAPETMNATGINLDLAADASADSSFTIGLELANANNNGPSGTFIDSATFTGTTTTAGFADVTLPVDQQLTAGTVYYVVVEAPSTPTNSTALALREATSFTPGSVQPYGYNDSSFARGGLTLSSGTSTTPSTLSMISYVVTTDGAYNLGNPITSTTVNPAGAASNPAEHFIFEQPSTGNAITSATVTLAVTNSTGTLAPVTVTLLDNNNNIIAQSSIPLSSLIVGTNSYTVNFDNVVLTQGAGYNLTINSSGSTSGNVKWLADMTDTGAAEEAATYQGTQGYAFTYNSSLNTPGTAVDNEDYIFTYTTAAVPEPSTVMLGTLGLGLLAVMAFRRQKLQA